jgi:hypothetical protein
MTVTAQAQLRTGHGRSCGCLQADTSRARHTRHGHARIKQATPTYNIWCGIKSRCYNPRATGYELYGLRGIKMCERWHTYENFLADMGPRPTTKHSIDRIDGANDYSPENCRWSTRKEQSNNRCTNHVIEYNGETMNLRAWADKTGISYKTLYNRVHSGWLEEMALCFGVSQPRRYEFGGHSLTLAEWAARLGMRRDTLKGRLLRGLPYHKVFTNHSRGHQYEFRGRSQNLTEWAAELGFDRHVLKCRLLAGWSIERAFTEPIHSEYRGHRSNPRSL